MDLKNIASYFMDTQFDYWDESNALWVLNWSVGYLGVMDRFQTIYNRPIHLRTFGFPVDTTMPASRTLRASGTTDIYIIGQVREDITHNEKYQLLVAGRLVTGLGGGLCVVHRKSPQTADVSLGMYLVDAVISSHYCDTEMYGVRGDKETDQDFDETYIITLPDHAVVLEDDFIILGTRSFRALSVYTDSGFITLRAEETADERVDVIYKVNTTTHTPGSTTRPNRSEAEYQVTGAVRNFSMADPKTGTSSVAFDLYIKRAHIDVTPEVFGSIEYLGATTGIASVEFDSKQEEWCIKCRA